MAITFTINKGKFILQFPYNERLIDIARSIPGAKWSKAAKCWQYPLSAVVYQELKEKFNVEMPLIERALNQKQPVNLKKCKFKTQPYQHQIDGVKFLLEKFGCEVK